MARDRQPPWVDLPPEVWQKIGHCMLPDEDTEQGPFRYTMRSIGRLARSCKTIHAALRPVIHTGRERLYIARVVHQARRLIAEELLSDRSSDLDNPNNNRWRYFSSVWVTSTGPLLYYDDPDKPSLSFYSWVYRDMYSHIPPDDHSVNVLWLEQEDLNKMFLVVALDQDENRVMVHWHAEGAGFCVSDLPDIRLLPLRVSIYLDIAREHLRPDTPSGLPLTAACQRVLVRPNEAFVRMWHQAFAEGEEVIYAIPTSSDSDDPDWPSG